MVERGLVVVNLDRCIGCHSCQAVCFYGQRDGGYGMVELSRVGGKTLTLPQYCRQCDLAACVEACPTEALKKLETGEIFRSPSLCVGCRSCAVACPFGVISDQVDRHRVPKCDGCADLVDEGRIPLCVAVCPASALEFVSQEQLKKEDILGVEYKGYHPFWRRS
jgi:Fe-S-cluster-containing dehydrogenase component